MGEVKLRLPMTIGRGRKADLIISHPTVSRIHCELYEKEGALVVRDNGSSNGTLIDDRQIKEAVVEPGQILKIGPLSFRAEYEWSGSMPDLNATAEVRDLSATQTMSSDDLLGEGEALRRDGRRRSRRRRRSLRHPPLAKAARRGPREARSRTPAKEAEASRRTRPPRPRPSPKIAPTRKTSIATSFDFNKDIEFVDDASQATVRLPASRNGRCCRRSSSSRWATCRTKSRRPRPRSPRKTNRSARRTSISSKNSARPTSRPGDGSPAGRGFARCRSAGPAAEHAAHRAGRKGRAGLRLPFRT